MLGSKKLREKLIVNLHMSILRILTILAIAIYHLYLPYIWDKQRDKPIFRHRALTCFRFQVTHVFQPVASLLAGFLLGSGHRTGSTGFVRFLRWLDPPIGIQILPFYIWVCLKMLG